MSHRAVAAKLIAFAAPGQVMTPDPAAGAQRDVWFNVEGLNLVRDAPEPKFGAKNLLREGVQDLGGLVVVPNGEDQNTRATRAADAAQLRVAIEGDENPLLAVNAGQYFVG